MNAVQQLRNKGCKVRVTHYRRYWQLDANNRPVVVELPKHESPGLEKALAYGGRTQVTVIKDNGAELMGESFCSNKDQFVKRLGVLKAVGRLQKFL